MNDPDGEHFPWYPTEPAVRAILHQHPAFDSPSIDLFCCGNTLFHLLAFASNQERSFHFAVQRIGNTTFFNRKTIRIIDKIGSRGVGHSRSFIDQCTRWKADVDGSDAHQRVIKFDFSGLSFVVRDNCDGYLDKNKKNNTDVDQNAEKPGKKDPIDISKDMSSLPLDDAPFAKLNIKSGGVTIPQADTLDIHTKSKHRKTPWKDCADDFLPRLWIRQTPRLVLAYRHYGRFYPNDTNIMNVKGSIKEWERNNATTLSKLASVVRQLIGISKIEERSLFEVRRVKNGPLEIWSPGGDQPVLPEELVTRWKSGAVPCSENIKPEKEPTQVPTEPFWLDDEGYC